MLFHSGKTLHMSPSRRPPAAPAADVEAVLRALRGHASGKVLSEMGPRYGLIVDKAFGVPMAKMQAVAKPLAPDHDLAATLWDTGWYEARMVACMIDDPAQVTPEQMDRWRADFDNWGIVDTVCFKLFDRTTHAFAKIDEWAVLNDEFGRRAAFALLACVALHGQGSDAECLRRLPLIEAAATDGRNFVRKAVNWALRAIGERKDPATRAAAMALAERLAGSADKTARRIGKDALRAMIRRGGA
jgi:3-methyladenine DNA glycosylase AlkD